MAASCSMSGRRRRSTWMLSGYYRDIVDELMNPRMPTLVNTDGEPIAPTTVEFALQCTPCEAFDRLASLAYGYDADALLADARRDGSGTVTAVTVPWTVAGNKVHRDWENTSLGTIEIDGRRLTVSVNSERRARRIRGLLAKRLGDAAVFARQQVESIEALLDKKEGHGPSRRELAQHEALQALPEVREMMRAQSERHSGGVAGGEGAGARQPDSPRGRQDPRRPRAARGSARRVRLAGEDHAVRTAPGHHRPAGEVAPGRPSRS